MARSMTGFGRASTEFAGETLTVEVSSVNHRFFDCSFRLPPNCASLEAGFREIVKEQVARGKIYANVRRACAGESVQRVRLNVEAARGYVDAAQALAQLLGTTERLSLDVLAQLEGVFCQDEPEEDMAALEAALAQVIRDAVTQLNAARDLEGAAMAADARARLLAIDAALASVEARLPSIEHAYEERLRNRLHELCGDIELKEERLALEIAFLVDKSAVHEEVVRLRAHLTRGQELLASGEAVGRDLNFLAQEIQREINTLGSKLRDVGVIQEVLRMKSELEKLREQVQNIE